jgi:hypothetical protein
LVGPGSGGEAGGQNINVSRESQALILARYFAVLLFAFKR